MLTLFQSANMVAHHLDVLLEWCVQVQARVAELLTVQQNLFGVVEGLRVLVEILKDATGEFAVKRSLFEPVQLHVVGRHLGKGLGSVVFFQPFERYR